MDLTGIRSATGLAADQSLRPAHKLGQLPVFNIAVGEHGVSTTATLTGSEHCISVHSGRDDVCGDMPGSMTAATDGGEGQLCLVTYSSGED